MKTLLKTFIAASLLATGCQCKNNQCLKDSYRIGCDTDPQNLDPRHARDIHSINLLHNLFEGLFRKDVQGKISLALCSSYEIYDGGKSYRFRLRESKWSNGEPVKASDFVYAWLSILDPKSTSSYAYQFFSVVGAKDFKEGKGTRDGVKIFAENDKILVVELEKPQAQFIELLTMHCFLPVNQQIAEQNSAWAEEPTAYVSNGPYLLKEWQKQHLVKLEKNPNFWQKDKLHLERIEIYNVSNETALHLYRNKELDWVGSPLGTIPLDAREALADELIASDGAGTIFLRVNVAKPPLSDKNFRHALSMAVDREMIVSKVMKGKQKQALGLVPLFFDLKASAEHAYQPEKAKKLFANVKSSTESSPTVTLLYSNQEVNHRVCQVIQHNWKEILGLDVELKPCESKGFYQALQTKDYDLALGSWYADIFDPSDFLEIFKEKEASTNHTGWENSTYQSLLNLSSVELDQTARRQILSQAQEILIDEMPLIPIYHASFLHLESDDIKGVAVSPLGHMDFLDAQ